MAMASPEEQLGQILAILSENSKGINDLKASMTEMHSLRTDILNWSMRSWISTRRSSKRWGPFFLKHRH
jgi:hypothetical protein